MWADEETGEDPGLTNLKLQKLLYYAQGHYLGEHGKPLFSDEIQAWAHGPVVPNEYHRLKHFGAGPIDTERAVAESFDWDDYRDVEQHLIKVWNTYAKYAAWALRQRTHSERPWKEAFDRGEWNMVISQDALREFFAPTA
ncbi:DUF4065 domain-containing protein [Cryptosporangium phraense]|uniref:DUF4065 domain-containing protein n=2 Tax=Cryptosporangium phraense TaxID=2593070 RepID=A0A545ANJ5_9ACTN|nr:DUF4065 domain-containing protein [Cryptosporangium phraense]